MLVRYSPCCVRPHITQIVAPLSFRLIHINVTDDVQGDRYARENAAHSLRHIELHSTESDVKDELAKIADLVIDGDSSLKDIVNEVLHFVSRQQS